MSTLADTIALLDSNRSAPVLTGRIRPECFFAAIPGANGVTTEILVSTRQYEQPFIRFEVAEPLPAAIDAADAIAFITPLHPNCRISISTPEPGAFVVSVLHPYDGARAVATYRLAHEPIAH